MPAIWINCSLLTSFFNNRGHHRVPNYECLLLFYFAVFTLATKIILTAKLMRRFSRSTSLFSFVTRHSLIVIRLLLHRQLKLPILQKELSGHGISVVVRPQFLISNFQFQKILGSLYSPNTSLNTLAISPTVA